MAGYQQDDMKGEDRWTIRLPDEPKTGDPPQQEANAGLPPVSADVLAAILGQFQSADELDAYLKAFPPPPPQ